MRYVYAALATILLIGSCSTAESDAPATTTPPETVATTTTAGTTPTPEATSTTTNPVDTDAVIGEGCNNPGQFGTTVDGVPVLCSETTLDGEELPWPQWRLTAAGGDVSPTLTATEAEAIAVARSLAPDLGSVGDHAVLLGIEEYAQTMRLAADSDIPPEEGFLRLVDGYKAANNVTLDESFEMTLAMLSGATVLLGPGTPGAIYIADIADWLLTLEPPE